MSDSDKIKPSHELSSGKPDPVIDLLLQALDSRADQLKQDIAISQEMVKFGIDTDLVGLIKKVVDNPMYTILEGRNSLDAHIAKVLTEVIRSFMVKHRGKGI